MRDRELGRDGAAHLLPSTGLLLGLQHRFHLCVLGVGFALLINAATTGESAHADRIH